MAKRKFVKKYIAQSKLMKVEPEITENLVSLLNWYRSTNVDEKTLKQWVIDYAGNEKLKDVPDKYFTHPLTAMCRLVSRGYKIDDVQKSRIDDQIKRLLARKPEKKKSTNKPNIQQRIRQTVIPVLAEVDFFVDEKLVNKKEHKFGELITDLNRPQIRIVKSHVQSYIDDFEGAKALKDTDKEYFEGYGMTVRAINSMVKYLTTLIEECDNFVKGLATVARKVKRKIKSPEQICQKVKINRETPVKPTKVIGASGVVFYNPRYNKLTYLTAADSDGLTIKGTTIIGYDEKKAQILRPKPSYKDKFMAKFQKIKGINALKRELKQQTYKPAKAKLSTRLNDDTLILYSS